MNGGGSGREEQDDKQRKKRKKNDKGEFVATNVCDYKIIIRYGRVD